MAITFERDDNNAEAPYAIQPAGKTGWIETNAKGEWTGKFSATKPAGAGSNWREVGHATVTLNDGRRFRAVLDESNQPISVIGDSIGTDPDQTKRWKDRQAQANKPPEERNNNGRRERWNPQANDGQGAWEDVGPAINTSTTGTADKPTIGQVEGTPMPDGTFDNTKPIWVERDANGQQVGPAKPLTQQQREQWEREKNGGLTDKEVRERSSPENQVGKPTGNTRTTSENGKTVKETEYLLPDGTKEWRTQEETAPPDRIGKPTGNTRQRTEGGKEIKETEYILPDGTKEWRGQEAPSSSGGFVDPAGAPTLDANDLIGGLERYSAYLYGEVKKYKESGGKSGISPEDATKAMEQRTKLADAAMRDQNNTISNQTTLRSQDITQRGNTLAETQSRRTTAADLQKNMLSQLMPLVGNMPKGGAGQLFAEALREQLNNGLAYAGQWGGLKESPEVGTGGFRALDELRQRGLAGIQTAAAGGPQIFQPRPVTGGAPVPDAGAAAAQAEAQRQQAQAAAPRTADVPPPPPAANPVSGAPITMPTTPDQPVTNMPVTTELPVQATGPNPTINPATGEPTGLNPLPEGARGPNPAINPVTGEPTGLPPTSEFGQPGDPNLFTAPSAAPGTEAGGNVQMAPRFLQEARYGEGNFWDPEQRAAAMAQRLGIDPNVLKQATAGLYA